MVDLGVGPNATQKVIDFVIAERDKALSVREWKHRLAGYGYSIRESEQRTFVTTLLSDEEICELPPELTV